jgi:hypothetical protein
VQWDQRGAGKSYSSALQPESLNIEQFVADTLELVQLLRSRFGAEKIRRARCIAPLGVLPRFKGNVGRTKEDSDWP